MGFWKLRRTDRSDMPEGIIALLAIRPRRALHLDADKKRHVIAVHHFRVGAVLIYGLS
jgi:hypothetical protein